jgi:hypothetical protein
MTSLTLTPSSPQPRSTPLKSPAKVEATAAVPTAIKSAQIKDLRAVITAMQIQRAVRRWQHRHSQLQHAKAANETPSIVTLQSIPHVESCLSPLVLAPATQALSGDAEVSATDEVVQVAAGNAVTMRMHFPIAPYSEASLHRPRRASIGSSGLGAIRARQPHFLTGNVVDSGSGTGVGLPGAPIHGSM